MLINLWINDDNPCNILMISSFNICLFNIMYSKLFSQIKLDYIFKYNIYIYVKYIYITNYVMTTGKIKNFEIYF